MNHRFPPALVAALLLTVSQLRGAIVSGQIVGESAQPLGGIQVNLLQVSLNDCCLDQATVTAADGSFQFDVPPRAYVIQADPPTPLYPEMLRVDTRSGDQRGLRIQVTRQPRRYVPDEPPHLAKISVSTPNERGQTTLRGSAGTVAANTFVILVNTDTGDTAITEAGMDGTFEATVFAPAGTSVLIKSDPYGDTMRNVRATAFRSQPGNLIGPALSPGAPEEFLFLFPGNMAALPGTFVDIPIPPATGGRVAIAGTGGWAYGGPSLPSWILRGSMNKDRFAADEEIEVTATISITSTAVLTIEKIGANALFALERLSFSDGRPAQSHGVQVSSILTPTGFGIMHSMDAGSSPGYSAVSNFEIPRVGADRAESNFTVRLKLPANVPSGYYRPRIEFYFNGYPNEDPPSRPQLFLDSSARDRGTAMSLPPIRVGTPAAPRMYWTLLTDALIEGTRGAMPVEDERCCALTPIIQAPSKSLVVPRIDEATQTPLVYRLEPFALMVGAGDRGLTPHPPAVRFRFPSGRLTARIERPDGGVDTIGPAPFVQARVAGPVDRHGRAPDPGGLSLHDAYQLSTLDRRFEITFPSEGPYRIILDGEIEDLAGNVWIGRGTYEIHVGRPLVLDTAVLPGTPFEVGNSLTSSVSVVPPLPARVEVRTQLYHGENKVTDRTDVFGANRFGAAVGSPVRFDQPGEYRHDISASYRDSNGRWWFGSRSWGGVVATPNTPIITHGQRGIDDLPPDQRPIWFFRNQTTSKLGSGHVHLPFHSGDVTWNQERDALIPRVTFDDREGSIFRLMRERRILPEDAATIGEAPFRLSRADGNDPHFDPSAVDLWAYAYRSIQRPAVRIREQISDTTFLPSLYWRFSDAYGQQSGVGRNGDRPNDFKFMFAAAVIRGAAVGTPQYSIYGSFFVLVPDSDPRGGTRTFPPFQGNGSGSSGGPLFDLEGKAIDLFFHPTALRPGAIFDVGQRVSIAGYSAPTLASNVEVIVRSPSGQQRTLRVQANKIGFAYDSLQDFTTHEAGVWTAKVKIWFDGVLPSTNGQVQPPYPTGDVLGSREGEFNFYVVDRNADPLPIAELPKFVRPADGPISLLVVPPAGLTDLRLHYTTSMPGFILEEGTLQTPVYVYDAQRLARDFPNLDLRDADGVGGVDTITISLLLSGLDAAGIRRHFARQIVLQGEQLLITEQKPMPPLSRRRSIRR